MSQDIASVTTELGKQLGICLSQNTSDIQQLLNEVRRRGESISSLEARMDDLSTQSQSTSQLVESLQSLFEQKIDAVKAEFTKEIDELRKTAVAATCKCEQLIENILLLWSMHDIVVYCLEDPKFVWDRNMGKNGQNIDTFTRHFQGNQRWRWLPRGAYWQIICVETGTYLCFPENPDGTMTHVTDGSDPRTFIDIEYIPEHTANKGYGFCRFKQHGVDLYITVNGNNPRKSFPLQVRPLDEANNFQKWGIIIPGATVYKNPDNTTMVDHLFHCSPP